MQLSLDGLQRRSNLVKWAKAMGRVKCRCVQCISFRSLTSKTHVTKQASHKCRAEPVWAGSHLKHVLKAGHVVCRGVSLLS